MNPALIETLLNQEESTSLDFKKEQYAFVKASDEDKAELLKDIVAFSNSWRITDAYILIGVEEVRGGRSKILGVTEHLDDHAVQQFVQHKSNKPINFSYEAVPFEGKQIGVIKIPPQRRPFYLKKVFGGLKKETVYIRRSSSTGEANLEEIAQMGAADAGSQSASPTLQLEFAEVKNKRALGCAVDVTSRIVNYDISNLRELRFSPYDYAAFGTNEKYEFEMSEYIAKTSLLSKIGLVLTNPSSVLAGNARIEAHVGSDYPITLIDWYDLPSEPVRRTFYGGIDYSRIVSNSVNLQRLEVERNANGWIITDTFGDIQPKAVAWSNGSFYIGASEPCDVQFEAVIYADNLPDPIKIPLQIQIEIAETELNYEQLRST